MCEHVTINEDDSVNYNQRMSEIANLIKSLAIDVAKANRSSFGDGFGIAKDPREVVKSILKQLSQYFNN